MTKEREHYDYSGATAIISTGHIVDEHWPKQKGGVPRDKISSQYEFEFSWNMRKASIEQIKFYMPQMDRETKVRAMKTIKKLEGLCQS